MQHTVALGSERAITRRLVRKRRCATGDTNGKALSPLAAAIVFGLIGGGAGGARLIPNGEDHISFIKAMVGAVAAAMFATAAFAEGMPTLRASVLGFSTVQWELDLGGTKIFGSVALSIQRAETMRW